MDSIVHLLPFQVSANFKLTFATQCVRRGMRPTGEDLSLPEDKAAG